MVDQPHVAHKDLYPESDNNSNDRQSTYIESPKQSTNYDTDDCVVWEANCEPWSWDCATSMVAHTNTHQATTPLPTQCETPNNNQPVVVKNVVPGYRPQD